MRTVLDSYGGNGSVLVDEMIGSSYQTVKTVATNIEFVKHVSEHMPEVYRVAQSISEIEAAAAGYVPTTDGQPTEVPTAIAGMASFRVDDDGTKIWVYAAGAWKSVNLA